MHRKPAGMLGLRGFLGVTRYGRHEYYVNKKYFAISGLACIAKEPELLKVRALC